MNKQNQVQELSLQVENARRLIVAMQERHGNDQAFEMVNGMIAELDPYHGQLLHTLLTEAQADAMGDAGTTIH